MLVNSILFLFLILFSFLLFFINNIYVIIGFFVVDIFLSILFISIILSIIFKVRLSIYLPFIIILFINFIMNLLLSSFLDGLIVTLRLIIMFIVVNLIIKKIGIYNIGYIIGNIFRRKEITLIISISLSFIPIMIKELSDIRRSLITKNYPLTFKNIIRKPSVFVITFFSNLFKRVNEMEKVLISKGIE